MDTTDSGSPSQGLGCLSILPPDVRTLIWSNFFPTGRDDDEHSDLSTLANKTDLRVLRASKFIYHELSTILYSSTSLNLDNYPTHPPKTPHLPDPWGGIRFKSPYFHEEQSLWLLRDDDTKEDTRFDNFPFHKLKSIEVNLYAPDPDERIQLISLWRNAIRTFRLLKRAVSLPPLTIHLEKYESHDWFRPGDELCTRYQPTPEPGLTLTLKRGKYFSHDMLIMPFCYLEKLKNFEVKGHSEELENKMNWTAVNWAKGLVSNKPNGYYADLEKRMGEDYIWLEICVDCGKRDWLRDEVRKFISACGCPNFLGRVDSFFCVGCMYPSDPEDNFDENDFQRPY